MKWITFIIANALQLYPSFHLIEPCLYRLIPSLGYYSILIKMFTLFYYSLHLMIPFVLYIP